MGLLYLYLYLLPNNVGLEGADWINVAQDNNKWRALENTVMAVMSSMECPKFLD
jgi:hypothetical protein